MIQRADSASCLGRRERLESLWAVSSQKTGETREEEAEAGAEAGCPPPDQAQVNRTNGLDTYSFRAGRLKEFLPEWKKLTSDKFILETIQGAKIPLLDEEKKVGLVPKNQVQGNLYEERDKEISELLAINVIKKSSHEAGEVISPVFMVPKIRWLKQNDSEF